MKGYPKRNQKRPSGFWTKERCQEDAEKYTNRKAWREASGSAYAIAHSNGWTESCCGQMNLLKRPNGFWTKAKCREDAEKHQARKKWQTANCSAYSIAHKNGWLDWCCRHMEPRSWTRTECTADARQYKTRKAWRKKRSGAYKVADKNGWLDFCCRHMKAWSWTKVQCAADAEKYMTRKEWKMANSRAYATAYKKDWLVYCCRHMEARCWSKAECMMDAKSYKNRGAWQRARRAIYMAAFRNGWLDACCRHMEALKKSWTKAECEADARKYRTRSEWRGACGAAYMAAHRKGWVDFCCRHMGVGLTGYSRLRPGSFYVTAVFFAAAGVVKFGNTNRDVDVRIAEEARPAGGRQEKIAVYSSRDGNFAADLENAIIEHFGTSSSHNAARRLGLKFSGSTETVDLAQIDNLLHFSDEFTAEWERRNRRRVEVEAFGGCRDATAGAA